jgi:hypothetical protein
MSDAQGSAQAVLLKAWMSNVRRIAHERRSFTRDFPAPPQLLTREDCDAIGFEFHDERSAWNFLDGAANSTVRIDFSPDLRHAAVSIKGADWCGALLWVDGEPVPVPRTPDGEPVWEQYPTWLDDRFVHAQVGGLWDHPLLDASKINLLGNIRGLLVWDAVKRMLYVERPGLSRHGPVRWRMRKTARCVSTPTRRRSGKGATTACCPSLTERRFFMVEWQCDGPTFIDRGAPADWLWRPKSGRDKIA